MTTSPAFNTVVLATLLLISGLAMISNGVSMIL